MDARRDFLKKAMLLSGAGWAGILPESISRAAGIDPAPGSTYLDAEHVVILMQENRSFDHCFGALKGVRGFNDPRFIQQPDGNPVWLQSNAAGETYAPFRFDIRGTSITWMGSTPHSRSSQVDAHNEGKYDRWLDVKKVTQKGAENMPMTLGYYTREDIPFNYALADAFTVCDQNFCSAMTSTTPNRFYLWSGTIRGAHDGEAKALVRNDMKYGEANWTTYPELLEEHGIPWRVYQNDITAGPGFTKEERDWLSNFGCNPLEYFPQYKVRFSDRYVAGLETRLETLSAEIDAFRKTLSGLSGDGEKTPKAAKLQKDIAAKTRVRQQTHEELNQLDQEHFDQLSPLSKELFEKAFTSNRGDRDYRQLAPHIYDESGEKREVNVPKGDVLHQFREDVNGGKLPTVSWLVGPANFTDHPSTPWYGSWYVSEVLDILTKDPEVWKKTVFIMTYDENDGYFDHIPPFVAPDPLRPETGKCSPGIDTAEEFIRRERELAEGVADKEATEGPIGLGFRVPMIIASPWTRGGQVCSQVFDHTSVFRFVQDLLKRKQGTDIVETNTSLWRKTVTGDLTAAFRPFDGGDDKKIPTLEKTPFIQGIYNAKFKPAPTNFKALTAGEIAHTKANPHRSPHLPQQEPGVKTSCALPYQLYADASLSEDKTEISLTLEARKDVFAEKSAGSPFNLYLPGNFALAQEKGTAPVFEKVGSRSYAVIAGDRLVETLSLPSFEHGLYHLQLHGPNGFYREHRGSAGDPSLLIQCEYERSPEQAAQKLTGNLDLIITSLASNQARELVITDHSYGAGPIRKAIEAGDKGVVTHVSIDLKPSHGWYDFSVTVPGFELFEKRYAGRVETGLDSISDPFMGRIV